MEKFRLSRVYKMQEYFGMKKIKTIEKYLLNTVEDLREELDRMFN